MVKPSAENRRKKETCQTASYGKTRKATGFKSLED